MTERDLSRDRKLLLADGGTAPVGVGVASLGEGGMAGVVGDDGVLVLIGDAGAGGGGGVGTGAADGAAPMLRRRSREKADRAGAVCLPTEK